MNIMTMKRWEFYTLPYREKWDKDVICNSIIILPAKYDIVGY